MKIELDYIEKLAEIVSDKELTELTLEDGETAIIIKKEKEVITTQVAPMAATVAVPAPQAAAAPVAQAEAPQVEETKGLKITSPMVGTFYKASSPGAAAFAEVGKTVSTGQVVCIIEAMKLMNEIESEVSGKIIEVCVEDGEPVEYGQTLIIVEA